MEITREQQEEENKGTPIAITEREDFAVISLALASQIRRYQTLGWDKDAGLKEIYERMKAIYKRIST